MLWLSAASVGKCGAGVVQEVWDAGIWRDSGYEKVEEDINYSQTKMRGRMLIALAMEVSTERLFIG